MNKQIENKTVETVEHAIVPRPLDRLVSLLSCFCRRWGLYTFDELVIILELPKTGGPAFRDGKPTEVKEQRQAWKNKSVLQKLRRAGIIRWRRSHRRWQYIG